MTKAEVLKFLNKVKAYYYNFSLEDNVKEEWTEKLKHYDNDDILRKFDEHLNGEYALDPPKLHFLTKYLKTEEEKLKTSNDYVIRCNLCQKEMYLSDYNNKHYKKCLLIRTLVPILVSKGQNVDYNTLDEYDYETLDKVYEKYVPVVKKDLKKMFK